MDEIAEGWSLIGGEGRGLWFGGVFALRDGTTGRSYFVGSRNIGKRLWDHRDWLRRGSHPCKALQADWSTRSSDFAFCLVAKVPLAWLLPHVKQMWIDRAASSGCCYNIKNAVPQARPARRLQAALPSGLVAKST